MQNDANLYQTHWLFAQSSFRYPKVHGSTFFSMQCIILRWLKLLFEKFNANLQEINILPLALIAWKPNFFTKKDLGLATTHLIPTEAQDKLFSAVRFASHVLTAEVP